MAGGVGEDLRIAQLRQSHAFEAFRPGDRVVPPVAEPQVEVELGRERRVWPAGGDEDGVLEGEVGVPVVVQGNDHSTGRVLDAAGDLEEALVEGRDVTRAEAVDDHPCHVARPAFVAADASA